MQNVAQGSAADNPKLEKVNVQHGSSSTPHSATSSPAKSETETYSEHPRFMTDSSESEEDSVSEVGTQKYPFMCDFLCIYVECMRGLHSDELARDILWLCVVCVLSLSQHNVRYHFIHLLHGEFYQLTINYHIFRDVRLRFIYKYAWHEQHGHQIIRNFVLIT